MYKRLSFPLKIVYRRLNFGNPDGRGVKEIWMSRWEGEGERGSKNLPSVGGGVDFSIDAKLYLDNYRNLGL